MNYKILFSIVLVFFLISAVVHAAVKPQDKAGLLAQLEKYKNEPAKLTLILALVDSTMDLTDEPELKQKIVETAGIAGVDIKQFPNIEKGTVPYIIQVKQQ
ncbi:MAG TPA: hypothetical protein VJJ21_02650, partial [Candidatus Nanoarchaeia archaeon]|nr:hypothetical protein [Candidatus Nanoarchaeia archaeon]